jgi:hypothetical protein
VSHVIERIEMVRQGSKPGPTARYSIVKRTGVLKDGDLVDVEERKVLEKGLTLADAKARLKYWREYRPDSGKYNFWGV